MRWSLILSTFVAAQFALSFATVIPSSDQLQRRAPADGAKVSSKTYRKISQLHPYAYKFDKAGGVTRHRLTQSARIPNHRTMLLIPKTDADHIFEHQVLDHHLDKHGLKFGDLHPDLKKQVKGIMNSPNNLVPVPAGINRGKGQVFRQARKGKAITPKKDRDAYIKLSYTSSKKTAKQLDHAFKKAGHDFGQNTVQRTLRNMMNNAKIMNANDPSPASSRSSSRSSSKASSKASSRASSPNRSPASSRASSPQSNASSNKAIPKRPALVFIPKAPNRKSDRIAAKPPKSYKV
ncbi:small secreted protein [Laccaria bicolor S238N-H82]|uniref:Small secreted protein n=1 Tax=Laccaria bicolor (strain S238N-H82 / ATCC MYA-4686) TaxID=486041 RepID=B0DGL7_LACBS|nr:small secreted protein [Laccaria bicolor S238N-H82]EDR06292.1 small secreted protein [Laccaria bicolor S238N-H82]|eukprot:XP_001883153.1 small secreted protein [Laccaria bicolor S238N-H82]